MDRSYLLVHRVHLLGQLPAVNRRQNLTDNTHASLRLAQIRSDISRELPKRLTVGQVQAADVVITIGCDDACPVYPGKRYLDWDLPDDSASVRPIHDEIHRRITALLSELT